MRSLIVYFLLCILAMRGASFTGDFYQLFPGFTYPSAPAPQTYPGYYNNGFGQQQQSRHREPKRTYKDICRLVNSNGFTNPGGVPKCPY